jgi:Protein NO VEIN, C-terminal
LIHHQYLVCCLGDLEWTERADVRFVREIDSELSVLVRGREVVIGKGPSRSHYDVERAWLLIAGTIDLAANHVAAAINESIEAGRKLKDLSGLVAILKCPPTTIRATLDDLGVRSLPDEDIEKDFEEAVDVEADANVDEASAGAVTKMPVAVIGRQDRTTQTSPRAPGERTARPGSDTSAAKRARPEVHVATDKNVRARRGENGAVASAGKTEARLRSDRRTRRKTRPRDRAVTYVVGPLRPDGSIEPSCLSDEERGREKALGDAAVERVCEFEREMGRLPFTHSHSNPGFDVESRTPGDLAATRTIEVKGICGRWTALGVKVSPTQFEAARTLGDQFWLYVVEHADEADRAIVHPIPNPFAKVTEYRFDHGWRQLADPREAPSRRHGIAVGDDRLRSPRPTADEAAKARGIPPHGPF